MAPYRLFSWEHSYFSGKVRGYLRYKANAGALAYEDVLATPELLQGLLVPATGTSAVPQLQTPDGRFVQDSSEIIDFCERAHPEPPVIPAAADAPRQRLACFLLELLADEWMVVYAFWERWHFGRDGAEPTHAAFNEQQWGAVVAPGADGDVRRRAGRQLFEAAFGIHEPEKEPRGVYAGLVALGATEPTAAAWLASNDRLLARLEAHFSKHDFVLGGLPSLADFALLGPLYAHLYRDPVSGFALRTRFPLVAEWVERTNHTGYLNARSYGQNLYSLGPKGELVGRPATRDAGEWLAGDAIPPTLLPVLAVFFEEMWPMLEASMAALRAYLASGRHAPGAELPGKTFTTTPGFEALQTGDGPLTHEFTIGGVRARRMVTAIHVWMLQRIAAELRACSATPEGRGAIESLLASLPNGRALLGLEAQLEGCRVRKAGGRISPAQPETRAREPRWLRAPRAAAPRLPRHAAQHPLELVELGDHVVNVLILPRFGSEPDGPHPDAVRADEIRPRVVHEDAVLAFDTELRRHRPVGVGVGLRKQAQVFESEHGLEHVAQVEQPQHLLRVVTRGVGEDGLASRQPLQEPAHGWRGREQVREIDAMHASEIVVHVHAVEELETPHGGAMGVAKPPAHGVYVCGRDAHPVTQVGIDASIDAIEHAVSARVEGLVEIEEQDLHGSRTSLLQQQRGRRAAASSRARRAAASVARGAVARPVKPRRKPRSARAATRHLSVTRRARGPILMRSTPPPRRRWFRHAASGTRPAQHPAPR